MNPEELLEKLQKDIPLSRHLGFQILVATPTKIHLHANLAENINHKGTGFGGSIYALAVLSAYSLVYIGLHKEKINTNNIVIQRGDIQYLVPVTGDFDIICEFKNEDIYQKFYKYLRRWNKAREILKVQILCEGKLCATLDGTFVVRL